MNEVRPLLEHRSARNPGVSVRVGPRARATVLNLVGDDAMARSLHVHLTIAPAVPLDVLDAAAIARSEDAVAGRALLELGSGGHQSAIEVDVGRGLALTVSGSALRVTGFNLGPSPIELGAFVSYAEARAGAPTLTQLGPLLPERVDWTLDVPAYASAVEVLALDQALRIEVGLGRAGDRWRYGEEVARAARMPRPLPIANGCARVRVTNLGPGTAAPVAIFSLAL